jgi:hypothetical protein
VIGAQPLGAEEDAKAHLVAHHQAVMASLAVKRNKDVVALPARRGAAQLHGDDEAVGVRARANEGEVGLHGLVRCGADEGAGLFEESAPPCPVDSRVCGPVRHRYVEQEMERWLGHTADQEADQAGVSQSPPFTGGGCSFGAGNLTGASSIC